ncbi:hypothetical protein [Streptomyces sp. Ag109_O5-10]|uniref:hypothetical protein n=1 Tax=Streptomyces sp. Ag109_O5-10 TaxID=1855349 RepID=UPI0026B9B2B6
MSWLNEEPRPRKILALAAVLTAATALALTGPANPAAHAAAGTLGAAAADTGRYFGTAVAPGSSVTRPTRGSWTASST